MALSDLQIACAQYLAKNFYRVGAERQPHGLISQAARQFKRDRDTIYNWLAKDEFLCEIEANHQDLDEAFRIGMLKSLKDGNPKVLQFFGEAAFPEQLDSYSRRQREKYELEAQKLEREAQIAKKLQEERPPLVIQYEETPAIEAPDLSVLKDDDEETG